MSIGKRIKEARKKAKLTQQELAQKTNLSRSYIGDIEIDRYNPSVQTLQSIAEATGISVSYLIGNSDTFGPAPTNQESSADAALFELLFQDDPKMKAKLKSIHIDGTFGDGTKVCDLSSESIARIEDALRVSFALDEQKGRIVVEIDE